MSMLKKSSFLLCLIIIMIGSVWFISLKNDNSSLIGAYIDGEYASNIPSKDAGYVVEKMVCDNEAVGEWNYDDWGLLVKNMTKKSKWNVYFRKGIKLADTITLVDATGKCPTVNDDGSVNVTSAESENSLLCMAPDNYGTSYYFRGNVQNNYVYFANLYWRIIRINGDGSIRMIYDGKSAHANGEANGDRTIGNSQFNETDNDNAYAGYMYGTVGSSTYTETHANIHDSTIKKYIDTWYENNIKDTQYEQDLADNIFCNDRSLVSGDGFGQNVSNYTFEFNNFFYSKVYHLNFICQQKNDSFTVNDSVGNKALKYPIALIEAQTVTLAGGYSTVNNSFYLASTSYNYWTMTPTYFNSSMKIKVIRNDGNVFDDNVASYQWGYKVRPVINLKAGSLTIGDGTISNAYRVS